MAQSARAQQKELTRLVLVREGRRLFAARGYAAVSLPEIVSAAGVTKGALYHHFDGKADLFAAVVDDVQTQVAKMVAETADAQDEPWTRLIAGCRAILAASTAPDVQQILLIDGPAVLGWSTWRAVDEATSGRNLADALTVLIDQGTITAQPVAPLAHLLSGAMNEAALWLAASPDPSALTATATAFNQLLEGLRAKPAAAECRCS